MKTFPFPKSLTSLWHRTQQEGSFLEMPSPSFGPRRFERSWLRILLCSPLCGSLVPPLEVAPISPRKQLRLHMHNATTLKKCGAVVFADLNAAFYRTVLEYVLGGLSDAESTQKHSHKFALSPQVAVQLRASAAQGTEYLLSLGVPPFWARAAADWHRCAAFHVPGSLDMIVTHAGTKPGDPLADLIFCIAFFQYQQELLQALSDKGLLIHLPKPGPFLLEPCDDFAESIPFGTPAFFDDFFVPLVYDAPAGHLEDIQKTVACLISVGHRFGISINTSEGKTEAMVHLVGTLDIAQRHPFIALFTTLLPVAPT